LIEFKRVDDIEVHIGTQGEPLLYEPLLEFVKDVKKMEYMYFVHSFKVNPIESNTISAITKYGSDQFCSALKSGNSFACQFHPERSFIAGLNILLRIVCMGSLLCFHYSHNIPFHCIQASE